MMNEDILQKIKMNKIILLLVFLSGGKSLCLSQAQLYVVEKGEVTFTSEASLENIKAESKSVRGVINPDSREFAFSIRINSFIGFNSEIQRVHFLENYMEQTKYPEATFSGKLIEDIPFDSPGTYSVRAKGVLEIHGIRQERILRGTITLKPGEVMMNADFSILLSDHDIAIPKIVRQKISEQIDIKLNIDFVQGSKS
jgi:polyisoprenoid-binding protein YceI